MRRYTSLLHSPKLISQLGVMTGTAIAICFVAGYAIRAYALCIIVGIIAAVLITQRRWAARGGRAEDILDVSVWAVPFGIIGGRLYHVITDAQLYFGPGDDPVKARYIWDGGLGIWGAVALGGLPNAAGRSTF